MQFHGIPIGIERSPSTLHSCNVLWAKLSRSGRACSVFPISTPYNIPRRSLATRHGFINRIAHLPTLKPSPKAIITRGCSAHPPPRVDPCQRVRRILIQVVSAKKPNRVFADEPTNVSIIVPEGVIIQPCISVGVLALHPKGLSKSLWGISSYVLEHHLAPCGVAGTPNEVAVGIRHLLRLA